MSIFILTYGTDKFFSKNYGDKFYCKSMRSCKRKLKELLQDDLEDGTITKGCKQEALEEFAKRELNKKTVWNAGCLQFVSSYDDEFCFMVEEQKLI